MIIIVTVHVCSNMVVSLVVIAGNMLIIILGGYVTGKGLVIIIVTVHVCSNMVVSLAVIAGNMLIIILYARILLIRPIIVGCSTISLG